MSTLNDERFGRILTWNNNNRTNYYEGSCGDIRGSAGEFYPMDRTKDAIEIFSSELCKNAVLKYEQEVEIRGVKGYKYSARDLFDNGKLCFVLFITTTLLLLSNKLDRILHFHIRFFWKFLSFALINYIQVNFLLYKPILKKKILNLVS